MNIQHSTRSDSWYTPAWIIEKVKNVLGEIDFDPASCVEANMTVGAKTFLSTDSLDAYWPNGGIFLNPPGGKTGNKSNTFLFWEKLVHHSHAPGFTHAIFLAFSAEALQTTQGKGIPSLGQFLLCVPKKRIKFDGHAGKIAPSHSNVIAYIPGSVDRSSEFHDQFSDVGTILNYRY